MTDRQPGAPGQYTLTIESAELQKFLAGSSCTVVLTRDDQPLVEGTPYNKASVLPDELANKICPSVTDPTPADAFSGLLGLSSTVSLASGSWSNNQQRVAVTGVTESNTVFVGPVADSYEEYNSCGVRCIAQTAGYLTFQCEDVPSAALTVNVYVRP